MQPRLAHPTLGRRLRGQAQVTQDLLDHRPLQDGGDDLELPGTAVRAAAMEESVGRRLAECMSAEQRAQAEHLVQDMEQAVRNQDAHRYHRLNLEFHDRLVEMAGNRKLTAIYRKLVKEIALFRRMNLADQGRLPASAQAHWEILRAIASGQPELAGRALYEHAIQGKARMQAPLARRPSAAPVTAAPAAPFATPNPD